MHSAQLRPWRRAPGAGASVNGPAIDKGYRRTWAEAPKLEGRSGAREATGRRV